MNTVTINETALAVKEYKGQRVVTLKEVDEVHQRPEGTARKRFNDNKGHFIEGTDYFKISPSEFRTAIGNMDSRQNTAVTLITESGYLMLVKSFTDDLAWTVQRELVNSYFRVRATKPTKTVTPGAEKRAAAMLLNAKSRTAKQMMALWTAAGVKPEYQALALGDYYRADGIKLPAIALKGTKETYDKTTIAKKLGILSKSGKPHPAAVGAIIAKLKITDAEREQVPYCRNGHDGMDYQYTETVVNKVRDWIHANNFPMMISAGDKNYSVQYDMLCEGI